MYLGRAANLTMVGMLCVTAISLTPVLKPLFVLVSLGPVFLSEAASFSPDGMTNGTSLLFVALVLRYALDHTAVLDRWAVVFLTALSVTLSLSKPAYFPLPLAYFAIPSQRAVSKGFYFAGGAVIVLAGIVAVLIWSSMIAHVYAPAPGQVDMKGAAEYAIKHPIEITGLEFQNLAASWRFYVLSAFGYLGYLDTTMPALLIWGYVLVLILTAIGSGDKKFSIKATSRLILLVAVISSAGVVLASQYLVRAIGQTEIRTAQGRYFLPILIPGLAVLYTSRSGTKMPQPLIAATATAAAFVFPLLGLWFVIQRYYLP